MFLLFYLIFSLITIRIHSSNVTLEDYDYPKIEELYPLPTNDQLKIIAEQFNQNLIWELGNMPISLTELEEITPEQQNTEYLSAGPGVVKQGHLFNANDTNAYQIDRHDVHPLTEHHIFFARHGLYLYTEDEPSSHLLRYGKYQARMAGHKINKKIQDIIAESGPLTRPIRLVSSTQTRAFETLYNIRLQLSNQLNFETEIIQDTGLTETVDPDKQRMRWLYFVREYLQPIKSKNRENTITIIASHGNLLTAFDHIIQKVITKTPKQRDLATVKIPPGLRLAHAQTLLYRTIGYTPIYFIESFLMDEIPVTVNHAQLRKDFYYAWAALHRCRSAHGREDMINYIRTATLDNIFSYDAFQNRMPDYETIVYLEFIQEYETHILPMLMNTCRHYMYRLPLIQANTNFGSFNRLSSPVPIPETEEEQSSPLDLEIHPFSAYGMPFPVDINIQSFRRNPDIRREPAPRGAVHPDSRILLFLVRHGLNVDTGDERTSYLTRLGVNQIRGIMSHVNAAIHAHIKQSSKDTEIYPINIVADPTIQSAESAFHIRSLLLDGNYNVSEQITDLGVQYNYFQRRHVSDFILYQQVQVMYMLRRYLTPDENNSTHPTLRIHIICGDGRLFTAFRQELSLANLFLKPHPPFSTFTDPGFNALKHGNAFFIESVGDDILRLHDVFTLANARGIQDEQRVPTEEPLQLPINELRHWFRSATGPCTLSYFLEKRDRLAMAIVNSATFYHKHIAYTLKKEWNPYLAGLFIYACRYELTLSGICNSYDRQLAANVQCNKSNTGASVDRV